MDKCSGENLVLSLKDKTYSDRGDKSLSPQTTLRCAIMLYYLLRSNHIKGLPQRRERKATFAEALKSVKRVFSRISHENHNIQI